MVFHFLLRTQDSLLLLVNPALLSSLLPLLLMSRTQHAYQMLVLRSLKLIFGTCAWVTLNLMFDIMYYVFILVINFQFLLHSVNTV